MNKRNIPIDLIKIIDEINSSYPGLIEKVFEPGYLITFKENGSPHSPFFFKIKGINEMAPDGPKIHILMKPASSKVTSQYESHYTYDLVKLAFNAWIELLKTYNEKSPVFDDPIIQTYYERFSKQFTILDDDVDSVPFEFDKQEAIETHYKYILNILETNNNSTSDQIKCDLIDEVKSAIPEVRTKVKRKVTERLLQVYAKVYYLYGKEVIINIIANLAASSFIWSIEKGIGLILP